MVENPVLGTGQQRYSRILVPLDGSDASEAALAYAAQIPCRELVLLHVVVDDDVIAPEWATGWEDDDEEEASARGTMEQLAERLRNGEREVSIDIRSGDIAEQVIEAGTDADLIVMKTHGRGAAGRLIFGSVADHVVRHGQTPTLLLRIGELTRSPREPKRVAVALDGSELAERSLPVAARLAGALGLPMVLMRAVSVDQIKHAVAARRDPGKPPHEQPPTLYEDTQRDVMAETAEYLEGHADRLRQSGLRVETQVLEGTAAFSLMWALTPEDVIVVATHGRGGYKRLSIGSVAEKLVREAPCPVLLQRATGGQ
ncbi:MAG TPA: universal stress protein [Thermomicrobiales bacterium]|nr:universal stress protein [Thermomicrobiales bacterium]